MDNQEPKGNLPIKNKNSLLLAQFLDLRLYPDQESSDWWRRKLPRWTCNTEAHISSNHTCSPSPTGALEKEDTQTNVGPLDHWFDIDMLRSDASQ